MKPIYNWFYFKNKLIVAVWKLMAVTIAAQVLTTPVSMFHFHQFPVYFLITNLLAVPLSSIFVLGEIVLAAVLFMPVITKPLGILLHWLIYIMNSFIEHMESLPFSLWNGLQVTVLQVALLNTLITPLLLADPKKQNSFQDQSCLPARFSFLTKPGLSLLRNSNCN